MSPENISLIKESRFKELHDRIIENIEDNGRIIIISSDTEDPVGGFHLSVDKKGQWELNFGREYGNPLANPPQLPELIKEYAFVINSSSVRGITDYEQYMAQLAAIEKSAEDNPNPLVETLLENMEQALQNLSQKVST